MCCTVGFVLGMTKVFVYPWFCVFHHFLSKVRPTPLVESTWMTKGRRECGVTQKVNDCVRQCTGNRSRENVPHALVPERSFEHVWMRLRYQQLVEGRLDTQVRSFVAEEDVRKSRKSCVQRCSMWKDQLGIVASGDSESGNMGIEGYEPHRVRRGSKSRSASR